MSNAPGNLASPHWLQGDDLTDQTSGWWTVVKQVERPPDTKLKIRGTWWLCRCRCGTEQVLPRQYIISRQSSSCGCRKRKQVKTDVKKLTPKPQQEEKTKKKRNLPPGLAISFDQLAKSCTCAQCGKGFDRLSDEWAYRAVVAEKKRWYCSWKCFRLATAKVKKEPTHERM